MLENTLLAVVVIGVLVSAVFLWGRDNAEKKIERKNRKIAEKQRDIANRPDKPLNKLLRRK